VAGLWFSPGTPVSSSNKTDRHDATEILLKVAFNTINHNSIKNFRASTYKTPTKHVGLVQSGLHYRLIKCNLFSP